MQNPLQLIPAKARGTVVVISWIIAIGVPFILQDVPVVWQHVLQALVIIAGGFAGAQTLSNLTPDTENIAIQARHALDDTFGF